MRYLLKLVVFTSFYVFLAWITPGWINVFIIHWMISLFLHSFLLHRYATHEQFTMSDGWWKFFYFCLAFFQGTSFLPANEYRVFHKMHHLHADTENDPHAPKNYDNVFAMMWDSKVGFSKLTTWAFKGKLDVDQNEPPQRISIEDYEKYSDDKYKWFEMTNIAYSWPIRVLWVLVYISLYLWFYASGQVDLPLLVYIPLAVLFVLGHCLIAPMQGALINWYGHKAWAGYRNTETPDESRNIAIPTGLFFIKVIMDLITMGEGPHNNHHADQKSPNFATKWYEIDPTYLIMVVLDTVGAIQLKRRPILTKAGN